MMSKYLYQEETRRINELLKDWFAQIGLRLEIDFKWIWFW